MTDTINHINHDMIDKLAYKGQGSNHPNILDYMNQANREIKYQAECPYCHAQVHQGIVGEPKSLFDGPDAEGSAWTFGLDITIDGSKMLCNGWTWEDEGLIAVDIRYCPMCGRKLADDEES